MVGHTGIFQAVVKACEETDRQLSRVFEAGRNAGYAFIVIADHGNAELARNPDGTPHTAHTTNLVPVIAMGAEGKSVRDGILADVAPTILDLMELDVPAQMTGSTLLVG